MKLAVLAALLLLVVPVKAQADSCVGKHVSLWVTYGREFTGLEHPDLYVGVKIGDEVKKTSVKQGDVNLAWWEHMFFVRVTSDVMNIDIWQENDHGDDINLGSCVEQLRPTVKHQRVRCDAKSSGFVSLFYKCQ